jgi:hypothetical protein
MTLHNFLLSLGVGSGLLAIWFVVRFPNATPKDFPRALLHVVAALVLGPMTAELAVLVWNRGFPLAAIFGILLPLLVYTFLSGAWVFKLATDTFQRFRPH